MIGRADVTTLGYVVDTMVLAMFVDSGHASLLAALAAGNLFVSPAIIDPAAMPPYDSQPSAEFAQGTFLFQQRQGHPLADVRFNRRMAFYLEVNRVWKSVVLSRGASAAGIVLVADNLGGSSIEGSIAAHRQDRSW